MKTVKNITKDDLARAQNTEIPDVIVSNLSVLFCGINPGLYTAASGWHFGRPGNRFWKVLFLSGFTPRQFHPSEQHQLLQLGIGITNVVNRATAAADEIHREEYIIGAQQLRKKVKKYTPRVLAILGIQAYRTAFSVPDAIVGPQDQTIGTTRLWILPNPSGLNANYQIRDFVSLFKQLKDTI